MIITTSTEPTKPRSTCCNALLIPYTPSSHFIYLEPVQKQCSKCGKINK